VGVAGPLGPQQHLAGRVPGADRHPQRRRPPPGRLVHRPAAGSQLDHPIDQRQPAPGVVVDDDQRGAAIGHRPGDGVLHHRRAVRVELGGRLVEQQQARPPGERPGQHQPLLLPAGEGGGGAVPPEGEAHLRQRPVHRRPDQRGRGPGVLQAERDVVPGAGHDQLGVRVLEDDRRPGPGLARRPAVDGELALGVAGVRAEHAGEGVQQRGLARAGRPGEQHPLAGLDPQVDVLHRPRPAAGVPEPPAGEPHRGRDAGARRPARGQTRDRPAANDDSAPLAARARVSAMPPRPATSVVLTTTSSR
jgi:hypothetical protein